MKDSGLSVLARLGEHAGLQVAAVIHVIRGAGLITNPPSDVKFLTGYFDKAIAMLAAQQGGQLRIPVPRPAPGTAADASPEASSGGESTAEAPIDSSEAPSAAAPNEPEASSPPQP